MKKTITFALCLILLLALCACGGSSIDVSAVTAERDNLKAQLESAMAEINSINAEYSELQTKHKELEEQYNTLVNDTSDWVKLTEEQKAAQLAQAEADRIAAEEAAKKAEAERVAAEKAAAEEAARKAAEEAAAREVEEKKGYDTGITYNDLARNPDDFKGKKVKFTGEVLQVSEVQNEIQIRLATKRNSWGGYSDDVVYLFFDSSLISSRILEDDIITIYGVAKGLHSYTTVLGAKVTLPLIAVEKIDT